jgi:hypothetical protein
MGTKIRITTTDIAWQQNAPAQADRTNYTPGKANAPIGEMTFPRDFRVYTGNPVVDGIRGVGAKGMAYSRTIDLERQTVCDHEVKTPNVSMTASNTMSSWSITGSFSHAITDAPPVLPDLGRPAGNIGVAE